MQDLGTQGGYRGYAKHKTWQPNWKGIHISWRYKYHCDTNKQKRGLWKRDKYGLVAKGKNVPVVQSVVYCFGCKGKGGKVGMGA